MASERSEDYDQNEDPQGGSAAHTTLWQRVLDPSCPPHQAPTEFCDEVCEGDTVSLSAGSEKKHRAEDGGRPGKSRGDDHEKKAAMAWPHRQNGELPHSQVHASVQA